MYLKKTRKKRIQSAKNGWNTRRFNLLTNKTYSFSLKIMTFCLIGMSLASCARDCSALKPDHIGLRTGIDFEIQEGCKTKTKPSVSGCLDWNL